MFYWQSVRNDYIRMKMNLVKILWLFRVSLEQEFTFELNPRINVGENVKEEAR